MVASHVLYLNGREYKSIILANPVFFPWDPMEHPDQSAYFVNYMCSPGESGFLTVDGYF